MAPSFTQAFIKVTFILGCCHKALLNQESPLPWFAKQAKEAWQECLLYPLQVCTLVLCEGCYFNKLLILIKYFIM